MPLIFYKSKRCISSQIKIQKKILKFWWLFFLIFGLLIFNIVPSLTFAVQGVPKIISYRGRITDSNGNLLSASNVNYYFKFSIWDSPTSSPITGTRLWPTSTPNITTSTVKQGVFSVNIGDTANGYPDALDFNFYSNQDVYLQIEVASTSQGIFETLSPRQRIDASGFAINAETVSGKLRVSTTTDYTFQVVNEGGGLANLQAQGQIMVGNYTSAPTAIGAGSLYYNVNTGQIYVWNATSSQWNSLVASSTWINSGNYLYPSSTSWSVGIGTTTPAGMFQIAASSTGNALLTVLGSGKVGIGTTTPQTTLDINGAYGYMGQTVILASTTLFDYFFGNSGNATLTGNYNTGLGYTALISLIGGVGNTSVGAGAGYYLTTGNANVIEGYNALQKNTTGGNNSVFGYQAGFGATSTQVSNSLLLGYQSGYSLATSTANILIGYQAGYSLVGGSTSLGSKNIVIGYNTDLPTNTTNSTLDIANLIYATGLTNFTSVSTTISNGSIGFGTSTPSDFFTVASSSSGASLFGIMNSGDIYMGAASSSAGFYYTGTSTQTTASYFVSGGLTFDTNAGQVNWIDLPVASSTSPSIPAGTIQSYSATIASNPILTIYGESDGQSATGVQNLRVGIGTTTPSTFFTIASTTNYFNVLATGNIGIGTTTPSSVLTVIGSTTISSFSVFTNLASTTPAFYIASSGYVGIGTTTPVYRLQIAGDIMPTANNLYSLGTSTLKWANVYAATTTVGDLVFGNNFRVTETTSTDGSQTITFRNQNGVGVMSLDENGNLVVAGSISSASSSGRGSSGIIGDLVSQVKSALSSLGLLIENGVGHLKELIVEKLTANTARIEKLEMVDKATGEIYCTWIENGDWQKVKGECETQPTNTDESANSTATSTDNTTQDTTNQTTTSTD